MPQASGAGAKYAWRDHDGVIVDEEPPIQNQWYTVLHAQDVRLLWMVIQIQDDLAAGGEWDVKWIIDGNIYLRHYDPNSGDINWVYRNYEPSTGGTLGLIRDVVEHNASYYVDKRGHDFEIDVRLTSIPGINQILRAWAVYETLEAS